TTLPVQPGNIDDRLLVHRPSPAPVPLMAIVMESIEEIAMLFDVGGEVERVLAHQPLGELGVPLFQRFDDAHVIDDRARGPVPLRNGHAAYRANMEKQ